MLHEPAAQAGKDPASSYKMSLGVKMFGVYSIAYMGFVAINIIKPILMEKIICLGLNLATVYGFGLIFLAIVMALIYNILCTNKEEAMKDQEDDQGVTS